MMSENERKIGIKLHDKYVGLTLGNSVFQLNLDQNGLPHFPESLKQSLPPYMPEMVKKMMKLGEKGQMLAVHHEPWCSEVSETGRCDCDPIVGEPFEGDMDQLTCSECGEFSRGEFHIHPYLVEDTCGYHWLIRRSMNEDMLYWAFEEDNFSTIFCHKCLEKLMTENGREFSDLFPDFEDDSSSSTLQ